MRALIMGLLVVATPVAAQPAAPADRSTPGQVLDSAGRIVTSPLRDLNIVRDGVPPALEKIMADPYSLKGLRNCADYAREIRKLTEVLGPDVDSPEARAAKETPTEFVLGATESVVGSLIPGRGIVRRVSGAHTTQQQAQAAVFAGQLRRGFLKGRAGGRGCRI